MKRLLYIIPVLGFTALGLFLFRSLFLGPPEILPSALIDKSAPAFALPALDEKTKPFSHADLAAGHVTVINFFASWCPPCHEEADTLLTFSKMPGVILYGVAVKDKRADTRAFLNETGDPFNAIVSDDKGLTAIDWGVSAEPETFVVDGRGIIRFKYVGPLTDELVSAILLPAIEKARRDS